MTDILSAEVVGKIGYSIEPRQESMSDRELAMFHKIITELATATVAAVQIREVERTKQLEILAGIIDNGEPSPDVKEKVKNLLDEIIDDIGEQ